MLVELFRKRSQMKRHVGVKRLSNCFVTAMPMLHQIIKNHPAYRQVQCTMMCGVVSFVACVGFSNPASADYQIVDSKNKVVGTTVASNTVLFRSGNLSAELRFQSPGFDPVYDNLQNITFYYKSTDCSGKPYYSDQADGKWMPNGTPSVYDVPPRGILIGIVPSKVDPNYFSQVDVYLPSPPFQAITFESIRRVGISKKVGDCEQTSGSGDFVSLTKIRTREFSPPFRMISK